jgi:hypothetical protein
VLQRYWSSRKSINLLQATTTTHNNAANIDNNSSTDLLAALSGALHSNSRMAKWDSVKLPILLLHSRDDKLLGYNAAALALSSSSSTTTMTSTGSSTSSSVWGRQLPAKTVTELLTGGTPDGGGYMVTEVAGGHEALQEAHTEVTRSHIQTSICSDGHLAAALSKFSDSAY